MYLRAADAMLGGAGTPEGRAGIHKDLDPLEEITNELKFSKDKCKALPLGWNYCMHQFRLGRGGWAAERDEVTWTISRI